MPTPFDAPPGIIVRYLPRPTGTAWAAWRTQHPAPLPLWATRPVGRKRLLLVHTNGAQGEGTAQSAYNWAMAAPGNTKPEYQVDRNGQGTKFLPSDRVGIANYKAAPFSIAIETADEGWGPGKPGTNSPFTPAQAETIALIIAWESELWDFPIEWPETWDGTGVGAHTEPFGYPYWTNSVGKPCPGVVKKWQLVNEVMPRAREIRASWHDPVEPPPTVIDVPREEEEMNLYRKEGKNAVWLADRKFRLHVDSEAKVAALVTVYGPVLILSASTDLDDLGKQLISFTGDV